MNKPRSNSDIPLDNTIADLDIDAVRANGDEPFQHPSGFIRLELNTPHKSRMNIWPATYKPVHSNIHDHVYDYYSRIICGELSHTPYLFDWHQHHGRHEMVIAHTTNEGAKFEKTKLFFQAYPNEKIIFKPGDEYKFNAFLPHQVGHHQLTATVSRKIKVHQNKQPIILVPRGEEINPSHIPKLTQKQIWEMIAEVIDIAKFSRKSEPALKPH